MKSLHSIIRRALERDPGVVFAYIYGSSICEEHCRDIGVYISDKENALNVLSDIKVALSLETDIPPDQFDVQIINNVDNLLYLQQVLNGCLLVDNNPDLRGKFIESFSMRYREAEGILKEAFF